MLLATLAVATTIATDAPIDSPEHAPAPDHVVLGTVSLDVLVSERDGEHHTGGRIGMDMIGASGRGPTRLAGGLRMMLGGVSGFGPEVQLQLGVAHAIDDRAVVALVAPLGATVAGADFDVHGYAGLAGIAALGTRSRGGGFDRFGVELAAELSNRGQRARIGIAYGGKDIGVGVGLLWQRDGDAQMVGLYFAETAGR